MAWKYCLWKRLQLSLLAGCVDAALFVCVCACGQDQGTVCRRCMAWMWRMCQGGRRRCWTLHCRSWTVSARWGLSSLKQHFFSWTFIFAYFSSPISFFHHFPLCNLIPSSCSILFDGLLAFSRPLLCTSILCIPFFSPIPSFFFFHLSLIRLFQIFLVLFLNLSFRVSLCPLFPVLFFPLFVIHISLFPSFPPFLSNLTLAFLHFASLSCFIGITE